jgi:hypothetical protein
MNDETKAMIIDERTQEEIPAGVSAEVVKEDFVSPNYGDMGALEIDDTAQKVLAEPLDEKEIRIRPDGMIYVSWTWYANRLNRAFGVAKWGLMPKGDPKSLPLKNGDVLVVWPHWLVVKQKPIGYSLGEMTYKPNNFMMSYADACEGAKSNALARNCKFLGMTLELWDMDFVEKWRNEHAEQYQYNGKMLWRMKKDGEEIQPTINEIFAVAKRLIASGKTPEEIGEMVQKLSGVKNAKKITSVSIAKAVLHKLIQTEKEITNA